MSEDIQAYIAENNHQLLTQKYKKNSLSILWQAL